MNLPQHLRPCSRRAFLIQTLAAGLGLPSLPAGRSAAAEPPADDPSSWAQFLGPRRDGVSRETGLNLDWKAKKPPLLWQVPLGPGFSSVAVVADRLYSMTNRGERDVVVCLNARTGKEIWAHDAAPRYIDQQRHGPGPRATPTYHRGRLYCLLPAGDLLCLQAADGKEVWRTNIFQASGARNKEGTTVYYWGMAGSPLIEGDRVIVQPGGNKDNSLVAFHQDTGKFIWGAGNDEPGYSSPIAITAAGQRQVISFTGQAVLSVDPTQGTVLWRYVLGNKFDTNCATPLWTGNLLFVSSAYGAGCAALEIVREGGKVTVREKWRNKNLQNHFTTSVILDGHVYGSHGDLGAMMLRCLSLATGEIKWEDRRPAKCSLLGVSKHLIVVSEGGTVRLIEAHPEQYTVKEELDGLLTYKAWAAPALHQRRLYLRDDKKLLCLDLS